MSDDTTRLVEQAREVSSSHGQWDAGGANYVRTLLAGLADAVERLRWDRRMLNAEVRRLRERRTAHSLKRQKAEQDAAELRRERIAQAILKWGDSYATDPYGPDADGDWDDIWIAMPF